MTRPDYCPVAQEPCQAMCVLSDVRCKIRDTAPQVTPQVTPQEKQEPVGYFSVNDYGNWEQNESNHGEPFYIAPPQRQPLTDEEVRDLWSWAATAEAERTATTQQHAFARAVERAHGIGGGE